MIRLTVSCPASGFRWLCGLALGLMMAAGTAGAVERTLRLEAQMSVKAGAAWRSVVSVAAGEGERVAFLHVEGSVDGGETWTALCYLADGGATERRMMSLPAGPSGSVMLLRARAAFRGPAGDVDYRGQAIDWDGTWKEWTEPPARNLRITVR